MRTVLHRRELDSMGTTPGKLRAELNAHRWQAVGPAVIVRHNGPLTSDEKMWAAVLHCGPRAALCSRTAAELGGLTGWPSPFIHVVVPKGVVVRSLPGVPLRVHESRRFDDCDVHPVLQPPRTRTPRSVIDAAVWTKQERAACGLLAGAVQQRLVTTGELIDELERAGRVRHSALLHKALIDIGGGAQAVSEIDFLRFCRRYSLPTPTLQAVRLDSKGRRRYLDATLPGRDGTPWRIEIDGGLHLIATSYWSDMQRDNDLVISGERILRFPSIAMHVEPQRMAEQLHRALELPARRVA